MRCFLERPGTIADPDYAAKRSQILCDASLMAQLRDIFADDLRFYECNALRWSRLVTTLVAPSRFAADAFGAGSPAGKATGGSGSGLRHSRRPRSARSRVMALARRVERYL
jgi:hypothetical protein